MDMKQNDDDIENFLQVGTRIIYYGDLQLKRAPRYHSALRGWQRNVHLLLDRPKAISGDYAPLQEGQGCSLRFIKDGLACAVETQVIDWDTRRSHPFLRACWPSQVRRTAFRRTERVPLQVRCTVIPEDGCVHEAEMRDISLGGCSLQALERYETGGVLRISMSLPDGFKVRDTGATVRSCTPCGDAWLLGCAFEDGQDLVYNDIAFFVLTTLERRRSHRPNSGTFAQILVIDGDANRCLELRGALEEQGLDTFTATHALDGLYRLRVAPPAAVLISSANRGISAIDVCRIVKSAPDYATLPLYLYGSDDQEVGEQARAAGAAGHFTVAPGAKPIEMALTLRRVFRKDAPTG
jgi:CheY-like chemotaxis protein